LHHNCLAFSRPHEHRDNKLNVFVIDGGLFYQRAAEYDLAMAEAAATVGARDAMFTLPGSEEANFDVEPMVASLAGCVGVGPALRSRSHSRNSITADDTDENGVWNLAMSGDEVNNDGVWQLLLPIRRPSCVRTVEDLKLNIGEHVVDVRSPTRFAPLLELRRADRLGPAELAGIAPTTPPWLSATAVNELLRQQELQLELGPERRALRQRLLKQHVVIDVPLAKLDSGVADSPAAVAGSDAGASTAALMSSPPLWTRLSSRSNRQRHAVSAGSHPMLYVYFEPGGHSTSSAIVGTVIKVPSCVVDLQACLGGSAAPRVPRRTLRFISWWDEQVEYEPNAKYGRVLSSDGLVGGLAMALAQLTRVQTLAAVVGVRCNTAALIRSYGGAPNVATSVAAFSERVIAAAALSRNEAPVAAEAPAPASQSGAAPAWVHLPGSRISEIPLSLIGTNQRLQLLKVTTFVWLRSLISLFSKTDGAPSPGTAGVSAEAAFDAAVSEQMHKHLSVALSAFVQALTPATAAHNWPGGATTD
jgi:hypothetical protein